jgi:hypothetical protein
LSRIRWVRRRISSIAVKSRLRRQTNGANRRQEVLARRDVAGRRAGADEGRALPRQRRTFVMASAAPKRERQRADFGCRAQPQVDPENVAFAGLAPSSSTIVRA